MVYQADGESINICSLRQKGSSFRPFQKSYFYKSPIESMSLDILLPLALKLLITEEQLERDIEDNAK
jgi:hypothetical protein